MFTFPHQCEMAAVYCSQKWGRVVYVVGALYAWWGIFCGCLLSSNVVEKSGKIPMNLILYQYKHSSECILKLTSVYSKCENWTSKQSCFQINVWVEEGSETFAIIIWWSTCSRIEISTTLRLAYLYSRFFSRWYTYQSGIYSTKEINTISLIPSKKL